MKSRVQWGLLGGLSCVLLNAFACSSDFKSCYDTRTCSPATAGSKNGDAGGDESAGAGDPGGGGQTSSAGSNQEDAGAAGEGAGGNGSSGRGGDGAGGDGIAGHGGGAGGTAGSVATGGSAGAGGSTGGAAAFGECREVAQLVYDSITAVKGSSTPPTLAQGQFTSGRYRRVAFDYYTSGTILGVGPDTVEVEVKGSVVALNFDHETWLITLAAPVTSTPESVKINCSTNPTGLSVLFALNVGEEIKDKISYQVTTASTQNDGFQLMANVASGWYRGHYQKVK